MSSSFKFNSWGAFVEAAKAATPATSNHYSHNSWDNTWSGSESFDATVALAENGWPDGAAKITELSEAIAAKVESLIEVPSMQYDVTGSDFDVASMLSGIPEYWSRLETSDETSPMETLIMTVHIGFLSNVSPAEVLARGAAVAALIECLQFANKRVELNLVTGSKTYGQFTCTAIRFKEAEQPLDRDGLAFAIMNASCFRRLIFALNETDKAFMKEAGSGYGHTSDPTILPEGIYIPAMTRGAVSSIRPTEWVIAELKKQGVTVTE